jgi:hypothetical protein
MAKLTAWIVTIIGVLLLLPLLNVTQLDTYSPWLIALGVLAIGITKLMRNYGGKKR